MYASSYVAIHLLSVYMYIYIACAQLLLKHAHTLYTLYSTHETFVFGKTSLLHRSHLTYFLLQCWPHFRWRRIQRHLQLKSNVFDPVEKPEGGNWIPIHSYYRIRFTPHGINFSNSIPNLKFQNPEQSKLHPPNLTQASLESDQLTRDSGLLSLLIRSQRRAKSDRSLWNS